MWTEERHDQEHEWDSRKHWSKRSCLVRVDGKGKKKEA
jgi:hypothetical protein